MRKKHQFVPSCFQVSQLEDRIVLNGSTRQLANSVLLQGLNVPVRGFRPHSAAAVSALVNLAYQSFQQDFGAARATYIASIANGTASPADETAFKNFITQRTNLLAQQVTNSFLLYGPGAMRGRGLDSPLPLIVNAISGVNDSNTKVRPRATVPLATQLSTSTPSPTDSATTISLDTIAQDNAIQASNVTTLNGVTIVRNGNFGNGTSHH